MSTLTKRRAGVALLVILTLLAVAYYLPALAEAPGNDDVTQPVEITSLPFVWDQDTSEATAAPDDPYPSCNWGPMEATVWFQFVAPATMAINIQTNSSSYTTVVGVYAEAPTAETEVACAINPHPLTIEVVAGGTYYIEIGANGSGPYPAPYPGPGGYGGSLHLEVDQVLPPANDNFGDARTIELLPFEDTPENPSAATLEESEPLPDCTAGYNAGNTVWYAFTPPESRSYTLNTSSWGSVFAAIYTGFSDAERIFEGCWFDSHTLWLEAGQTYYIQIGSLYGYIGELTFRLDVTPPPVIDFWVDPSDPSIFDDVHFYNWSYDPGCWYCEGLTAAWDFGDGATSTEWEPSHRYQADGDYTVSLTVAAADGRTASANRLLSVRTHDVAITRFTTPQAASVGQTRQIAVEVNNTRQPETVEVYLYKSTTWGWQPVGSLVMWVPVRPANRTTSFKFSYTLTDQDAAMGRINFRAEAQPRDVRDALPMNNEAISLPTKVNP